MAMRKVFATVSFCLTALFFGEAIASPNVTPPLDCDRSCLYGFVENYLDALAHHDPARLPWRDATRFTENNVVLPIGDGLWATVTGLGSYKLMFADPTSGQVGLFGVVDETSASSPFAVRMKIQDHRISELETLVFRLADAGRTGIQNFINEPQLVDNPILLDNVPEARRRPREQMIAIADGYFDTLQLNDGTLHTQFDENCNRRDNGLQSTNNPALTSRPIARLGCEAQFKLGYYRYDDRLRARRFPLVDEERGLVLAAAFIDHSGRLGTYELTDGTVVESPWRRPHSLCMLELFKIVDGRIRQIEAVFINVPYGMPSPWVP
jgi:hypothetical protein